MKTGNNRKPTGCLRTASPARKSLIFQWAFVFLLCSIPAIGGLLSLFQLVSDGQGDVIGLGGARGISISPDGSEFFVAGENADSISSFHLQGGSLFYHETIQEGVDGAWGLRGVSSTTASPDGRHVYAVAHDDNSLIVLARDATADELRLVTVVQDGSGGIFGLHGAVDVAVSPDDKNVLIASRDDAAVVVLSRDATSDELSMLDLNILPLSLYGATAVVVSPDGRNVYVTATSDNNDSIVSFSRDETDGRLDFIGEIVNGMDGITGLEGLSDLTISPDGDSIYSTARLGNAVGAFRRDPATGNLSLQQLIRDGEGGIFGLRGPSAVLVNPARDRVFVANSASNVILIFRRDVTTGELAYLETGGDFAGVENGSSLAMDSSGQILYLSSNGSNALLAFDVAPCIGQTSLGDSDSDGYCDDQDLCLGDDSSGDEDGDGICGDLDACPGFDDSIDSDGDGSPDGCDLCQGDDSTGDIDGDGICDDLDQCPLGDDSMCVIFTDGFESGSASAWSMSS